MAIHKKNNYTSPEVEIVEFKMEKGFQDSQFTFGNASYSDGNPQVPQEVTDQGTQDYNQINWNVSSSI